MLVMTAKGPRRESGSRARGRGLSWGLLLLIACNVQTPPTGTAGAHECSDTDPPPITSGGEWGAGWEPPIFPDLGNDRLDVPQGQPPGDPPGWVFDGSTKTYYRASTTLERLENGWVHHTLLVVPPKGFILGARDGASIIKMDIPLAAAPTEPQTGLAFADVVLERQVTHESIPFTKVLNLAQGRGVVTDYTTAHFYLPQDLDWGTIDDTAVRAFTSDKGAVELNGATYDRSFRLTGSYDAVSGDSVYIEIAPPSGTNIFLLQTYFEPPMAFLMSNGTGDPGPGGSFATLERSTTNGFTGLPPSRSVLAGQCADGLDNDADTYADECDFSCLPHPDFQGTDIDHVAQFEHTKDVAIIGDARFCTRNSDRDIWEMVLMDIGSSAAQTLNWVEAPGAAVRVPPVRFTTAGCFIFDNVFAAEGCHETGACPAGAVYPYAGVDEDWGASGGATPGGYMAQHWNAFDAIATEILDAADVRPANMVLAVVDYDGSPPFSQLGGQAYFDPDQLAFAGSGLVLSPSVVGDGPNLVGSRAAHEIGHTLGLAHDDTTIDGIRGFMFPSGGPGPVLEWDADSNFVESEGGGTPTYFTQGEVWTQIAIADNSPRPPGFGHVGCTNATCAAAHPSLTCVTPPGWCVQN